jgi:malate dehydrogenase (oxaloacetate-decarboxylating)
MSLEQESLKLHKEKKGKIEIKSKVPLKNKKDLSLVYTPGVAEPCNEIHKDKKKVYDYTSRWNMVAVVSDGSSVLGLGNIGPEAALPVMEGKAVLFKQFGGVDAFPVCLSTQDTDKIVETVRMISPSFGGISLEDISAPRCFEIESRLKKELDIPVFHDDQHGTAVVVLAGLMNALKVVGKNIENIKVAVSGAGAAGIAVTKILLSVGAKDVILCDTKGLIYGGRENLNPIKEEIAKITNRKKISGSLADAMKESDVFIGVSVQGAVSEEMVSSMNENAVVFAMANPIPEIYPDIAKKAGARIIATGRSDFPNQINNVLAFPGIFRGALDVRASDINDDMKLAASYALADLLDEPREDYIIPDPFDKRVAKTVAKAVAGVAKKSGVSRI